MFSAIGRSFQLAKVCLRVLAVDKELTVFPLLSSVAAVLVMLSFVGVGYGIGSLERIGTGNVGAMDWVLAVVFYVVLSFVAIFFNSALVYAAHFRLAGGDPNIRTGLYGALNHIPAILVWTLVSATVGIILRILGNQAREQGGVMGFIAQIIVAILGAAWTMLTYFVVPLIVIEGRNFRSSFRGSLELFRSTWGEQVVGNFGLGMAAFLAFLLAALVLAVLLFALLTLGGVGVLLWVVIAVVTLGAIALVFAAMGGIYKAALYLYATSGQVPEMFPSEMMQQGFHSAER